MFQIFNNCYRLNAESISCDLIQRYLYDTTPRRVCITDAVYTENEKFFNPPFKKAIEAFFYNEFHKKFDINRYGKYYIKYSPTITRQQVLDWTNKYRNIVFINDALPLSISLGFYKRQEENELKYTRLGNIVHAIKYRGDKSRINALVNDVATSISSFPYYKDADFICAIPPSNGKGFDLPTYIASQVSPEVSKPDISKYLVAGEKRQLKQTSLDNKITELSNWNISINTDIRRKTIILIDDLYQSGSTMMYIAKKLQEAGAKYIYGLSIVKNLKNTDNCNSEGKYV